MTRWTSKPYLVYALGLAIVACGLVSSLAADENAKNILRLVSERYRTLENYYFEGSMSVRVDLDGYIQQMDIKMIMAAAAPDKRRMEMKHPAMGMTMVSNGDSTWTYSQPLNKYTREAMIPLSGAGGGGTAADDQFGFLGEWLATYRSVDMKHESARILGDDVVKSSGDLIHTVVLEVTYRSEPGKARHAPDTLWVDIERYIVLKEAGSNVQQMSTGTARVHQVMIFHESHVDEEPPESLFRFVPPPGASEVPKLSMEGAAYEDFSGEQAPNFSLEDVYGTPHTLEKFRGKVVLLDFWATWCGPCRLEMPHIEKLHKEFAGKGLVVLGVDSESAETQRRFLEKNGYSFASLVDARNEVGELYRVRGIPTVFVIDRDGKIAAHFVGLRDEAELRAALKTAGIE